MQRIKKAYAENGDLKIIPDTPPLDGSENWEQGRGYYYELDNTPNTGDPLALNISRKQDNYFKNVISKNIKHWQENSYPNWFDDIEYPKNATVKYTDGNIYVSKVDNNTALPINTTNWTIYDPSSLDLQFVKLTGNQTIAGVKTFSSNIVGNITGNSATATKLATARTIGGVSFNGTANINLPGVNTAGNQNTSGNAGSATKLQTARTINGVAFNGTANITVYDSTKAPLASPALTGTPTAPTATVATNNTQIATTAFVKSVVNASSALGFTQSLSTNGWTKLPNGLIIQWGESASYFDVIGNSDIAFTFPIAFPTSCLNISATMHTNGAANNRSASYVQNNTKSKTGFRVYCEEWGSIVQKTKVSWIAIGY